MSRDKGDITPGTSVADLLRDYPALEETLLQFSPAFAALKNPVLRKTVARVTSLQQAAKVGNVPVVEMVNVLRKETGMAELGAGFCPEGEENPVPVSMETTKTPVTFILDVRPIIEEGDHPKEIVLTEADKLLPGECMELISPFPLAPLITLIQQRGFRVTMPAPEEGLVRTFVER